MEAQLTSDGHIENFPTKWETLFLVQDGTVRSHYTLKELKLGAKAEPEKMDNGGENLTH